MTAPCTRCGRDCEGSCLALADGTRPGTERLVGRRCSVRLTLEFEKHRTAQTERVGKVLQVLPSGRLWIRLDAASAPIAADVSECEFHVDVPPNWWEFHSDDCGTAYRGCAPDCPKDRYERTGKWDGP